jgi:hypothetical protein
MKSRSTVKASTLLAVCAAVLGFAASSFGQAPQAPSTPAGQTARGPAGPPPPCGPGLTGVKNIAPDSRCFELRTYTVRPEGPGDLDLLHRRFREHTNRLFVKHGMTIVGFWHPTNKPNALIYLMAYKDRAARDASWAAFQADPEWVKVRTDLNIGVTVDAIFMNATDYSPMK